MRSIIQYNSKSKYTKMLGRLLHHKFSLLTKVPKTVRVQQQSKSWFKKLFTANENSATYVLLKQLFDYLQNSPVIGQEDIVELYDFACAFASRTDSKCDQNQKQQSELPRSQQQKYTYNLQAEFFPKFAKKVNTAIPTENFQSHYSEAYQNKLQMFAQLIKEHEWSINPNRNLASEQYVPLFTRILYENRVGPTHVEVIKFAKYYVAHKKYLGMLGWTDLVGYKVKWGLQNLKYIAEVDALNKSKQTQKN